MGALKPPEMVWLPKTTFSQCTWQFVTKLLAAYPTWSNTWEFTLGRNHCLAQFVARLSTIDQLLEITCYRRCPNELSWFKFVAFFLFACLTNVVLFKGHSMAKLYGLLAIDTLLLTKGSEMAIYSNLFNSFGYFLKVVEHSLLPLATVQKRVCQSFDLL